MSLSVPFKIVLQIMPTCLNHSLCDTAVSAITSDMTVLLPSPIILTDFKL